SRPGGHAQHRRTHQKGGRRGRAPSPGSDARPGRTPCAPRQGSLGRKPRRVASKPSLASVAPDGDSLVTIVDTSVWIHYLNGVATPHTDWLDRQLGQTPLGLTDLILCEILQGIQQDSNFAWVQR